LRSPTMLTIASSKFTQFRSTETLQINPMLTSNLMKKKALLVTGSLFALLLFAGCSSEKSPENVDASDVEKAAAQMKSDADKAQLESNAKDKAAEANAKAAELAKKAEKEADKKLSEFGK